MTIEISNIHNARERTLCKVRIFAYMLRRTRNKDCSCEQLLRSFVYEGFYNEKRQNPKKGIMRKE